VVNVLAPLLLPIFGILLYSLASPTVNVMAMVKDGQLGWAVVAMGASTMYELWDAVETHRNLPALSGAAMFGTITAMGAALVLAVGGAVVDRPLRPKQPPVRGLVAWIAHYQLFVGSAVMAVLAALTYTYIHFSVLP
jgi:hypothetical protein